MKSFSYTAGILAAALLVPTAAYAESDSAGDALCIDRPGFGTPACTVKPGEVVAELGIAGWDHSADPDTIEDETAFGDLALSTGIDGSTQIGFELPLYTHVRNLDRATGIVSRDQGIGDLTLSVRHGLAGPQGPVAVQGFVTLPTGATGIGAGDWGAGVLVPIDLDLPGGFEFDLTPELDASVNASGSGRHLTWGGVVGLSHSLGRSLTVETEVAAWREEEPAGHFTDARTSLSLAWQPAADWQLDAEVDLGLSAAAPRHSLMVGVARRF